MRAAPHLAVGAPGLVVAHAEVEMLRCAETRRLRSRQPVLIWQPISWENGLSFFGTKFSSKIIVNSGVLSDVQIRIFICKILYLEKESLIAILSCRYITSVEYFHQFEYKNFTSYAITNYKNNSTL